MAPSLRERVSAWGTRMEVRGLLGRLRASTPTERMTAIREVAKHIATDERVVPALLRVLADEADEAVRCAGARALETLGQGPVVTESKHRAMDGLVDAFRVDSAYSVRASSARTLHALGWTPQDLTERAAAAAMRNDREALRAMIREGHRESVLSAVARELTDGDDFCMVDFIREVGAGSPSMVGALERFVHQREQRLASVADNAHRGGGDPDFVRRLLRPCADTVSDGREALAALRASVAAPSEGAHGTLRRVAGHSLFYKCPGCGVTLRKRDVEGVATALGWTSCSECAASFSYADVYYHGKYDIAEVEGACFVCGASLRGPEAELSGKPCPSCGVLLPTTTAAQ